MWNALVWTCFNCVCIARSRWECIDLLADILIDPTFLPRTGWAARIKATWVHDKSTRRRRRYNSSPLPFSLSLYRWDPDPSHHLVFCRWPTLTLCCLALATSSSSSVKLKVDVSWSWWPTPWEFRTEFKNQVQKSSSKIKQRLTQVRSIQIWDTDKILELKPVSSYPTVVLCRGVITY